MKVIYIRDSGSKGYLRIGLSDGDKKYDLTVSESEYREAGALLVGDYVNETMYDMLTLADTRYRSRLYALRMLAYADNNEKSITRKLVARSIPFSIATETAREMVSLGYVNEHNQLAKIICEEVNRKLTGPNKLRPKLMAKGYKASDIDAVIDELIADGEIDFQLSKERLIEKKLSRGATKEEKNKLLYKNGYEIC